MHRKKANPASEDFAVNMALVRISEVLLSVGMPGQQIHDMCSLLC